MCVCVVHQQWSGPIDAVVSDIDDEHHDKDHVGANVIITGRSVKARGRKVFVV